jgi:hypothetical protein
MIRAPPTPIADNTNQEEEHIMTVHEYFMNAIQDDARRAGERDRLLLEARRAHKARRQYMVPVAQARHRTEIGKIVVSSNVRHQALTAGTFLLGRRSYEWLVGVLALSQRRAARQTPRSITR